ncbi:cytochrome c oxidase subunit 3 [Mycobacterium sp. CVI_P3]|uniref:Probable cytochrome c oxidase subunit 3 n=1 Tax=Mycobacterium pinniadriaticum TaxID=2994102 RepID=A0ABT3SG42_9MYCO|nr:cytochrome c oxidase subunit 3 [Mycobacterium pinniadriaticum]MCX2931816.1 cytochrome c oxidase subunit 3 [Mycobacterium pinniadriaticum]MCX2938109.1 cytochrome c oxidase subunit 3 [Mycobacterium pinniadriaticum]
MRTIEPETSSDSGSRAPKVPGEPGIWVFIFGDLLLFGYVFGVFLVNRAHDPGVFIESQRSLNVHVGVLYTLLLLTSSLFIVRAMSFIRAGDAVRAPAYVLLAIACGAAFAVIKVVEYSGKVSSGITLKTNNFYLFYFFMTGLHLGHVLLGLVALGVLWRFASRAGTPDFGNKMRYAEGFACFWHMVDQLWLVIFPLLYLLH